MKAEDAWLKEFGDNTKGTSVNSVNKDKPPRFFSWKWFKWIGGALLFHKYTSRDWAVYHLSSYATHFMWLMAIGGGKFVVALWSKLPVGLTKFAELAWIKVTALVTAIVNMVTGQ